MKVYTKTGDGGETSLYGGKRVKKSDARLEAYGTVDELNAALGLVLAQVGVDLYRVSLKAVQADLFILGTELAASEAALNNLKLLPAARVDELEQAMDNLAQDLPELKNFIFPGGNAVAGHLHLARTICRRAERAVVKLGEQEKLRPLPVQYLNRLADYLFILARHANVKLPGGQEELWSGRE